MFINFPAIANNDTFFLYIGRTCVYNRPILRGLFQTSIERQRLYVFVVLRFSALTHVNIKNSFQNAHVSTLLGLEGGTGTNQEQMLINGCPFPPSQKNWSEPRLLENPGWPRSNRTIMQPWSRNSDWRGCGMIKILDGSNVIVLFGAVRC